MTRGAKRIERGPLQVKITPRHRRIIRLAHLLFGSDAYQVVEAGIELYERKFHVLETGRRFMEDGTLVVKKDEDPAEISEAARIAMIKDKAARKEPLSIFDNPLPRKELDELIFGDDDIPS